MTVAPRILAFSLVLLLVATAVNAQRETLDDSPSPRQIYDLDLEMQPHEVTRAIRQMLNDEGTSLPPLAGYLRDYDIRLNTRRYVGQKVRIYLRLPTAIPGTNSVGDIELSWQASGQWLEGSVSTGQEALLFEGEITMPVTGGTLNLRMSISADTESEFLIIEPIYEIEVIS